jgi:hypothetical protein
MSSPTPPQAPPPVPASALSRYNFNTFQLSQLAIGTNYMTGPFNAETPMYWYVVVDLTNLAVVLQAGLESETDVPPQVLQYLGNPRYFLYVIGNVLNGYNVPQGKLYEFLTSIGAGPALVGIEQTVALLGTGTIINFSYILAATMSTNDSLGFEASSFTDFAILNMQFLPVLVDGSYIYAPIQASVVEPAKPAPVAGA